MNTRCIKLMCILCLLINGHIINPFGIKKACILSVITSTSYMLYNDYRYALASYKAYKNERTLDQLLTDLTQNAHQLSPHPTWWITQYQELIVLKESAIEYKNKALLSRLFNFLYRRCKQPKAFQLGQQM